MASWQNQMVVTSSLQQYRSAGALVHLLEYPVSDWNSLLRCCVEQYVCMFLSAGEPGNIKKIQTSVAAARKVFRVMRVRGLDLLSLSLSMLVPSHQADRQCHEG